jgi:hypothetical protein
LTSVELAGDHGIAVDAVAILDRDIFHAMP